MFTSLGEAGQGFIGAATEAAKVLGEDLRKAAEIGGIPFDDELEPAVLWECILFEAHATNRFALRFLSFSGRELFIQAFLDALRGDVDPAFFSEQFNDAELHYAKCRDFIAAKGEGLGGTVCWEFAKRITAIVAPDRPEATVYFSTMAALNVKLIGKTFVDLVPI